MSTLTEALRAVPINRWRRDRTSTGHLSAAFVVELTTPYQSKRYVRVFTDRITTATEPYGDHQETLALKDDAERGELLDFYNELRGKVEITEQKEARAEVIQLLQGNFDDERRDP